MAIKREGRTFIVEPSYTELVSPARFLKIYKTASNDIESVRIIPAALGSAVFGGRLLVRRKTPIYRTPFRNLIK